MPQDDFEGALFRKTREPEEEGVDKDDIAEWFARERAEHARRLRQDAQLKPRAPPQPATGARVDEEGSQKDCIVGPYGEIEPICKGNAHHIVPDMAYRLGASGEIGIQFNREAHAELADPQSGHVDLPAQPPARQRF
ncbi:hypothetical protein [Rhizobium sp. NFR03]|uniref:hypothetical protein n=1 Tax=Rhizobium sp. NFR03 TaxID=1566263 RepID=UPI000A9060BD|nr:hypothetical protein [Rhizobium sp. NFR03]